ncbi:hypothetical protein AYI70_g1180 [Smittium culicis]|uniref:Uncharacterized protein n=1 Tax=Smittium culicis TaxID=133412 RepID=A0A1R1YDQ3_9FUNG|nr:hypothetical protein AYI70_g1180 [Smittium culicis]
MKVDSNIFFPIPTLPRDPNFRFRDVPELNDWNRSEKTLVLYGVTGTGKTEFAKTLFTNPLLVNSLEDLKRITHQHDGLIFDEVNLVKLGCSRELMISITDIKNPRSIPVKYTSAGINANMPRVFCTNVPILYNDDAIRRRVKVVEIIKDLRIVPPDFDRSYNMDRDAPTRFFINSS